MPVRATAPAKHAVASTHHQEKPRCCSRTCSQFSARERAKSQPTRPTTARVTTQRSTRLAGERFAGGAGAAAWVSAAVSRSSRSMSVVVAAEGVEVLLRRIGHQALLVGVPEADQHDDAVAGVELQAA